VAVLVVLPEREVIDRAVGRGDGRGVRELVLEELAPSQLFGPHGAAVVGVLEAAQRLSLDSELRKRASAAPVTPH
jgi:hypothetical protein